MSAPLLTSAELLAELNEGRPAEKRISRSCLHAWLTKRPQWRACIVEKSPRKVWLSRQKLIDIGVLMRPERTPVIAAGPSFAYVTEAM